MDKDNNTIEDHDIAKGIRQVEADRDSINVLQSISQSELEQLLRKGRAPGFAKHSIRRIVYASISVAAIVAVIVTFNLFNNQTGGELYQAYYSVPDNEVLASRGTSSDTDISPEVIKFYDYYDNKQYIEGLQFAMSTFDDAELSENTELLFYISICQLEINKNSDAEKNLIQLSKLGDSFPFYQAVDWYLALTYLKQNKKSEAKNILIKIKEDGSFYSEKATEVLGKLKL